MRSPRRARRPNTLSEFLAEDRILENIIGSGHTHGYTRNAVHRTTTFYRAREGQVPEGYHTYVSPDHREYFKKVHLNGLDLYRPKMS